MVDWLYDEVILAADLVSRNDWLGVRRGTPEAIALSSLLRRGALHGGQLLPENFRSPSSIQRKTYDLATAVEGYPGVPTRGSRLDAVVIAAFRADTATMQARASAVRDALASGETLYAPDAYVDEIEAREGGILEHLARRRERDPHLRQQKIEAVRQAGANLDCEVCGFDFKQTYGSRGDGYIEVHHIEPLHVTGERFTRLSDLALLCANCHRMCHRGRWIRPVELAHLLHQA